MKSVFTYCLSFQTGMFSSQVLMAQCNVPSLKFYSPVLLSGTNGQVGSVYKFAKVGPGLDEHVSVIGILGGATLYNIDDPQVLAIMIPSSPMLARLQMTARISTGESLLKKQALITIPCCHALLLQGSMLTETPLHLCIIYQKKYGTGSTSVELIRVN